MGRVGRLRCRVFEAVGEDISLSPECGLRLSRGDDITEWGGQRAMGGSEEEMAVTVKCTFLVLSFNFVVPSLQRLRTSVRPTTLPERPSGPLPPANHKLRLIPFERALLKFASSWTQRLLIPNHHGQCIDKFNSECMYLAHSSSTPYDNYLLDMLSTFPARCC